MEDFEFPSKQSMTREEVKKHIAITETPRVNENSKLTRGEVLLSAHKTINGKRQDAYGNPEDSFQIIANLWDGYITTKMEKAGVQPVITSFIQAHDVMLMMALMKIARIQNNPKDKDSYRDALGYLALACDYMSALDLEKD